VFLHELVSTSAEYGSEVVLFTARPGQSDVDAFRDVIRRGDVDGFVVAETNYDDPRIELLGAAGFPFVAFGRSRAPVPFSWVDVDGGAGIAAAARHLHTRGHRRIALVAWPEGSESGDDRVEGYRRALDELGLPVEEELLVRVARVERGREAWRTLRRLDDPPTGVVCVQDVLAIGVVAEARAFGLKVGDDLAIGFDDIPVAVWWILR